MDKEVDVAKMGGDFGKEGVDRPIVGHVALFDKGGADAGGERLDPFFEDVAGIAEAQLGPFCVECLGDAPGDRVFVGDSEDQSFFSTEQAHLFSP